MIFLSKKKLLAGLVLAGITVSSLPVHAQMSDVTIERGAIAYPSFLDGIFTLRAFEGERSVFYPNDSLTNLTFEQINTQTSRFDLAMELYNSYSNLPVYPQYIEGSAASNVKLELNKGSVALLPPGAPLGSGGQAAGLGLNAKAEIFYSNGTQAAIDLFPTDARSWEIGYYELGRAGQVGFKDYFEIEGRGDINQDIGSSFPRLVTFATLADLGINHATTEFENFWRDRRGQNPYIMKREIDFMYLFQGAGINYLNYYDVSGGHLQFDFDGDGSFDRRGETVRRDDVQATAFYFLREQYGHEFMVEFFKFASENNDTRAATTPFEAACNIILAANAALERTTGQPRGLNVAGQYLENEFRLPANCPNEFNLANTGSVVKGNINTISWNIDNPLPNTLASVYINLGNGDGFELRERFNLDESTFDYLIPTDATQFELFIGLHQSGASIFYDTIRENYDFASPSIDITANDIRLDPANNHPIDEMLQMELNWEINAVPADSEIQVFINYADDNQGWLLLARPDIRDSSISVAVPLDSAANIFLGVVNSGAFIASNSINNLEIAF